MEQDMQDVANESWMETKGEKLAETLPESPASVNLRTYIDGFAVQFTMRSTDVAPLIAEVMRLIRTGKAEGWKPSWKEESVKPVPTTIVKPEFHNSIGVEGDSQNCPLHPTEKLYKKEGLYGTYFTHGWKDNGYWMNCNGKTIKQGRPVS